MKILLTGHRGFIGSRLISYLKLHKKMRNGILCNTYSVTGLDIQNGDDLLTCDLNYDVDVVIHLAGVAAVRDSLLDPIKYWQNNVMASERIFQKFASKRIIYASSSSAAEPALNPYGFSKYAMELIAPKSALGLRFTTVWEEDGRPDMFMTKLFNGQLKYITDHSRDFIHVQDVVDVIQMLLHTDISGVLDVGTGISNSLKSLTDLMNIKEIEQRKGEIFERQDNLADITKLRNLGWQPKVNLVEYIKNKYNLTYRVDLNIINK